MEAAPSALGGPGAPHGQLPHDPRGCYRPQLRASGGDRRPPVDQDHPRHLPVVVRRSPRVAIRRHRTVGDDGRRGDRVLAPTHTVGEMVGCHPANTGSTGPAAVGLPLAMRLPVPPRQSWCSPQGIDRLVGPGRRPDGNALGPTCRASLSFSPSSDSCPWLPATRGRNPFQDSRPGDSLDPAG